MKTADRIFYIFYYLGFWHLLVAVIILQLKPTDDVIGGISKLEYTVSVSIYQRLSSKNDYNIFQSMEWKNLSKGQQMAFYKIFTDKDPL